ncbi:hypothetical protein VB773_11210 [Haloarculaceae archaeon H-GB2-1]|nr:hypothetical protein [Haloarculaceae archaeon H-GB1-1]MEA5386555.1 hypothetical protein [Haloarculaceae archaeon H-GB11]MEA5408067.1 hypothetical protein [Haloarculaceae archaeon H-GB2-1]
MPSEMILPAALALIVASLGCVLVFHVETAMALQRRYAETVSWAPPSEHPEYYGKTAAHRKGVFQFGGVVLLLVGISLLTLIVYGTFFAA